MSVCIVNVSFREKYLPHQLRLAEGLAQHSPDIETMYWRDELPEGSPSHQDLSYAFKLYAMEEARKEGFDIVLWLDAGVKVVKPIEPIIEEIKRRGVLLVADSDNLAEHCSDECLAYFQRDRAWARDQLLTGGAVIGIDLRSFKGAAFYYDWWDAFKAGLYKYDRWDESIFGCLVPRHGVELMMAGGLWDWENPARDHSQNILITGYET